MAAGPGWGDDGSVDILWLVGLTVLAGVGAVGAAAKIDATPSVLRKTWLATVAVVLVLLILLGLWGLWWYVSV